MFLKKIKIRKNKNNFNYLKPSIFEGFFISICFAC